MTTTLGKILVLVTTALSWTLAVLVFGAYTQAIDWGWRDPRKDIEKKPIPSEKAKREQLVNAARASALRAQAGLNQARARLHAVREQYPKNHLWYDATLRELRAGDNKKPFTVRELEVDKAGRMVLDPSVIGMPKLGPPVPGLTMPELKLRAELQSLQGQMDVEMAALQKLDKEQKAITLRLSPLKDAQGQIVRKGLDDLAEVEAQTQSRLREEMSRLRPGWTRELAEAQLLLERRDSLRRRLDELQQKRKVVSAAP
jgi:hypothetical protein